MLALIALFLPLFPLSVVPNLIYARLHAPLARAALLLLWPQIGVSLLYVVQPQIPGFVPIWALLSAGLYAVRLLTMRDLGSWAGLFASSALALTWALVARGADETTLRLFVFWFSLPPALIALLTRPLIQRFGAAYAGLFAGLAERQPRLGIVLTAVVLSTVATPPFPSFFALLNLLHGLDSALALGVLGVWLIWGWAATRLFQGLVAGHGHTIVAADFTHASLLTYSAVLAVFAAAGLWVSGGGL